MLLWLCRKSFGSLDSHLAESCRYMADFWSFSIAGYFLPLILRAKGVDTFQSTADTYRSYIWICEPQFCFVISWLMRSDLPGVTATMFATAVSYSSLSHST